MNRTLHVRRIAVVVLGLLALPAWPLSAPAMDTKSPAGKLVQSPRPLVIAHRGYSQVAPENTLPAFRLAIAAGADLVELDYYHSRDGVPVVFHDATLDRTTDAVKRWREKKTSVTAKTAEEIRSLDAGAWFATNYAGTRVPLLTEALELIQATNITLIERKGGEAAACVKLLRERGLINRVVVQSFDWEYLRDFNALAPEQVLGALGPPSTGPDGRKLTTAEKALSSAWLDRLQSTHAGIVVWNSQVSRESVQLAHKRGLKVWIYTIDDPAQAASLLDLGIDGIITNNPALIWKVMATRR